MTHILSDPSDHAEVERLLEASLLRRARRLPGREVAVEVVLSAVLIACVLGLIAGHWADLWVDPIALAMVVAYAVASRVDYPIATGVAVPTQLFLVGLFAHADARLVPLLAMGGLCLGTVVMAGRGRSRWDRVLQNGGDAVYVLGPTLVLVAAGSTDATTAAWPVIVAAFGAQCVVEFLSSSVRDWVATGLLPRVQLRVLAEVWAVDAALTPIGVMAVAAAAATSLHWAPLGLLPLVALVAHVARDRTERTERLRRRLAALTRERERLNTAVRRIGDALASDLDMSALVAIVTTASVEALDADVGRGVLAGAAPATDPQTDACSLALRRLLGRAESMALADGRTAHASDEYGCAVAVLVGPPALPVATVSLARAGAAFGAEQLALLDHLAAQAGVSASNVVDHEALRRQALTDDLTGLANHRRFHELLAVAVASYEATNTTFAVLLIDLDDFKQINDAYGHQTGDLLLRAVADRVRATCRSSDAPARYGGEEIAVLLPDTELAEAERLADRLRSSVERLCVAGPAGVSVRVTASVGVAVIGACAPNGTALVAAADSALYEAKAAGKNQIRTASAWSLARSSLPRAGMDLAAQLRHALHNDELVLQYQPKIALSSGDAIGAEALIRWNHPELGLLGPARFLPWAEGTDLMPEITRWVLDQALAQAVAWRLGGLILPVAINVTAQDLVDPAFPDIVADALRHADAVPCDLRLEITEHIAISDGDLALVTLAKLRDQGIGISLDDFGRGHSSLTRLRYLPVDELKLDREFLQSASATDRAIVRAAVSLGRELGLTVIGEGVEDAGQLQLLTDLGCCAAQGYHIAPPLLPDELESWLDRHPMRALTGGPSDRSPDRT